MPPVALPPQGITGEINWFSLIICEKANIWSTFFTTTHVFKGASCAECWNTNKLGKFKEHMKTRHLMHVTVYLFLFKEHSLDVFSIYKLVFTDL